MATQAEFQEWKKKKAVAAARRISDKAGGTLEFPVIVGLLDECMSQKKDAKLAIRDLRVFVAKHHRAPGLSRIIATINEFLEASERPSLKEE